MGNTPSHDKIVKEWIKQTKNPNLELLKEFILSKYKHESDYKFLVIKKDVHVERNSGTFFGLNEDLFMEVLMWFDLKDLVGLSSVCKYFESIIQKDEFWRRYYLSFFIKEESECKKNKKQNWKNLFFQTFYPLYLVTYESITLDKVIGRGGSGATIYKAKVKKKYLIKEWGTKFVAFKVFKIKDIFRSEHSYDDFTRELTFLCSLHHPNVLNIYGCCLKSIRVGILVELCENKSIAEYMKSSLGLKNKDQPAPPKLTYNQKLSMMVDTAKGMNYMHLKRIIHKDLKNDNVLLTKNFTAKVFDFGTCEKYDPISRLLRNRNISYVGTARYIAPEVVLGKNYDFKVDVFAFGIMMFEVLCDNFHPYGDQQNIEKLVACDANMRPKINPEDFPDKKYYVTLMRRCWQQEPKRRPGFRMIIKTLRDKEIPRPPRMKKAPPKPGDRKVIDM